VTHVASLLAGRYRLERPLATGGMGQVHVALDERLDRRVAVKVLREESPEFAARLRAEALILARLDHPALIRVFDADEHEGEPFIVMELVEGDTLSRRLADGPLTPDEAAAMARDLGAGLAHAHQLEIIHRDVKPSNVILPEEGPPRLVDFGIARLIDSTRLTQTGLTIGTAVYLAPEQLRGDDAGPPADVYSLGLVLIEGLTGERPFTGTQAEMLAARLAAGPPVPDALPAPWPELLRAMTALDPDERPTADEVVGRLSPDAVESQVTTPEGVTEPIEPVTSTQVLSPDTLPPPPREPMAHPPVGAGLRRWVGAHWRPLVLAVVALALVLVLALVVAAPDEETPPAEPAPPVGADEPLPPDVAEALERLEEAVQP
jgi:serine/threonine protein kinase